jgi:c-di-GMP-binding flagellar brake protein YcgR
MTTTLTERRNETRVSVRIPVKYKLMDNQGSGEQIGESENVSQRGVFMWTAYPLEIGTQVELKLRMPSEVSGSVASEVHCTARVVRIRERDSGGLVGVGLRIERYHATPERDRWAN